MRTFWHVVVVSCTWPIIEFNTERWLPGAPSWKGAFEDNWLITLTLLMLTKLTLTLLWPTWLPLLYMKSFTLLRQHDDFHITNACIIKFSLRFLHYGNFYFIAVLHLNDAMLSIIFAPFLIHHTANIKAAEKKTFRQALFLSYMTFMLMAQGLKQSNFVWIILHITRKYIEYAYQMPLSPCCT